MVRIEVRDTGPGIPETEQDNIFKEFHRLNARASASEGMGLGLAIVHEIAQQHGALVMMEDAHSESQRRGLRVSIRFAARRSPDE